MRRLGMGTGLGVILVLVIVGAALGTATPFVSALDGYTPTIVWDFCPFGTPVGEIEGETIDCGYLTVPQNRADPDGAQVELAFAILYSTSTSPVPDPILYLEGGPGGSALSGIDAWLESPFRARRDIILIDQRGTGYSYPFLGCWEVEYVDYDAYDSDDAIADAEADALRACRDRLTAEDEVDFSMYTSAHNAADIADLRQTLDLDEWNLFGISYGTRLALTIMRDHPDGVRSVILDSAYPPVVDAYEEYAVSMQRAFDTLFTGCAADATCNAAYPDLDQRFYDLVNRWDQDPVTVPDLDEAFYGDDLVDFFFGLFYDSAVIPYLPQAIYELASGDYETFITLYDGHLPGEPLDDGEYEDDLVFLFVDEVEWMLQDVDDDTYYGFYDQVYDLLFFARDVPGFAQVLETTFAPDDASYLQDLLFDMAESDVDRLAAELYFGDVDDSDGMFNSVECNEEVPFNTYDEAVALSAAVPEQFRETSLLAFELFIETCAVWDSGVAAPVEDAAVASAIPTLIVAGEYDPVTPPEWGRIAGQTLSSSVFFEFPGVGHAVIDGGDCPLSMMVAFLDNPATVPASDCIAEMGGPDFWVP